ncbi:MAG: hypothetical protein H0U67_14360 [Gemmatimonadetes bacterium]|nr:hypothetical protein [Gemmatimonadota bacterium]
MLRINPAVVALFAYTGGFLIVNASTGRFHPVEYQLLRSQYFAAALLFSVLTAIPGLFGFVIGRSLRIVGTDAGLRVFGRLSILVGRSGTVGRIGLFFLAALPSLFFAWVIQGLLVAGGVAGGGSFYFVYYSLVLILVGSLSYFAHPDHPFSLWHRAAAKLFTTDVSYDEISDLVVGFFSVILAAGLFGSLVYPYVKPQYGGGAAWIVRMQPSETIAPNVRYILQGELILVDEDPSRLRLVACSAPSNTPRIVSFQVPRSSISYVQPIRVEPIPRFERECIRQHQRALTRDTRR